MQETDVHTELDLLIVLRLVEIRADAPVLLGRIQHLVVDPAAPGRLEQRVVEEEREPPAVAQHAGYLGDRAVDVVDVLEDEARDDAIERGVRERQLGGLCTRVVRTSAALDGDAELVARRVDPDDVCTASGEHPADLPVATSDVEDHRRRPQLLLGERHDLLDVLGVGALGEPLDPPAGVLLPQLAGRVAHRRETKGARP